VAIENNKNNNKYENNIDNSENNIKDNNNNNNNLKENFYVEDLKASLKVLNFLFENSETCSECDLLTTFSSKKLFFDYENNNNNFENNEEDFFFDFENIDNNNNNNNKNNNEEKNNFFDCNTNNNNKKNNNNNNLFSTCCNTGVFKNKIFFEIEASTGITFLNSISNYYKIEKLEYLKKNIDNNYNFNLNNLNESESDLIEKKIFKYYFENWLNYYEPKERIDKNNNNNNDDDNLAEYNNVNKNFVEEEEKNKNCALFNSRFINFVKNKQFFKTFLLKTITSTYLKKNASSFLTIFQNNCLKNKLSNAFSLELIPYLTLICRHEKNIYQERLLEEKNKTENINNNTNNNNINNNEPKKKDFENNFNINNINYNATTRLTRASLRINNNNSNNNKNNLKEKDIEKNVLNYEFLLLKLDEEYADKNAVEVLLNIVIDYKKK
jgi:hypothetical protein